MTKNGLNCNSTEVNSYISIYTSNIPCCYLRHIHQSCMANKISILKHNHISQNKLKKGSIAENAT